MQAGNASNSSSAGSAADYHSLPSTLASDFVASDANMLDLAVVQQQDEFGLPSSGLQADVLPQVCIVLLHLLSICLAQMAALLHCCCHCCCCTGITQAVLRMDCAVLQEETQPLAMQLRVTAGVGQAPMGWGVAFFYFFQGPCQGCSSDACGSCCRCSPWWPVWIFHQQAPPALTAYHQQTQVQACGRHQRALGLCGSASIARLQLCSSTPLIHVCCDTD